VALPRTDSPADVGLPAPSPRLTAVATQLIDPAADRAYLRQLADSVYNEALDADRRGDQFLCNELLGLTEAAMLASCE
jgi:hypothetical protein